MLKLKGPKDKSMEDIWTKVHIRMNSGKAMLFFLYLVFFLLIVSLCYKFKLYLINSALDQVRTFNCQKYINIRDHQLKNIT
jgi:hypothetical protein